MAKRISIYLAGPVSGCNDVQKSRWREQFRRAVEEKSSEFRCINPLRHEAWSPFVEMCDIDDADLMVANLWKESIGTVLGIAHARKSGKPVVLVDPNHINSKVLGFYVPPENTVATVAAAADLVLTKIGPGLRRPPTVVKRRGQVEAFRLDRMERSLTLACAQAGVNDMLVAFAASELQRRVYEVQTPSGLKSDAIKRAVFDALRRIADSQPGQYAHRFHSARERIEQAWRQAEENKDPEQHRHQLEASRRILEAEAAGLKAEGERLRTENAKLNRDLNSLRAERDRLRVALEGKQGERHSPGQLRERYQAEFPQMAFAIEALDRLSTAAARERSQYERQLKLMDAGNLRGKHEVRGTDPVFLIMHAGHQLRIYFRQTDPMLVLLVGKKNQQEADCAWIKSRTNSPTLAKAASAP